MFPKRLEMKFLDSLELHRLFTLRTFAVKEKRNSLPTLSNEGRKLQKVVALSAHEGSQSRILLSAVWR